MICWFRLLHIIQNPVDLCHPEIIGRTPKFIQMSRGDSTLDPTQHECLQKLPLIFYRAMRGISVIINAFLGIPQTLKEDQMVNSQSLSKIQLMPVPTTPPGQRKTSTKSTLLPTKTSSKSTVPSASTTKSAAPPPLGLPGQLFDTRHPLSPSRPRCNSILHLFGSWLFDAALARVKLHPCHRDITAKTRSDRRSSSYTDTRSSASFEYPESLMIGDNTYETGRAEACGALCRIFCAHKTGEEILPVYYSRFYLAMYYGLQTADDAMSGQVLASILFNSCDLLRVDLDGVQLLVPYLLEALQLVLTDPSPKFKLSDQSINVDGIYVDLRRACIHLLQSMVCLPLHFKDLEIKDSSHTSVGTTSSDSSYYQSTAYQRLSHSSVDIETAYGLFGDATSLVCHRLMSSWKADLNTALAAMELLSGLSKVSINPPNLLMCKRTVIWICEFIVFQCSRPAPAHSRDLHSMIVAAFKCLTLWLVEHSRLMYDKECLHFVLEVVELGISGSKSQKKMGETMTVSVKDSKTVTMQLINSYNIQPCQHNFLTAKDVHLSSFFVDIYSLNYRSLQFVKCFLNRASDPPKYKGDKQLMPASMRVKDAAESVLTCIIQHGAFPPPCGPESLFSLLDEKALLKYSKGTLPEQGSPFRYFVLENSIIVALLEQPLGNFEDPLPTVTALIRGPFGRHAWTMQDKSIPTLESLVTDKMRGDLNKLKSFIEKQIQFENHVSTKSKLDMSKMQFPNSHTECKQPKITQEYQTARLFLSHYGFLSLEALKTSLTSVQPQFLEFLHSLGWPVDIRKHAGWTGHISSSWKIMEPEDVDDGDYQTGTGGSIYDGRQQVLYWADVASEVAFVVPSSDSYNNKVNTTNEKSPQLSHKKTEPVSTAHLTKPLSLILDRPLSSNGADTDRMKTEKESPSSPHDVPFLRLRRLGRQPGLMVGPDTKVFVVWLENFEDHENFPVGDLLSVSSTGLEQYTSSGSSSSSTSIQKGSEKEVFIIFIHALQNGLFRIHMQGSTGRISMAIPLIDGMVVSRRTLGNMVRQTAINICRRKRLESETYQPPHVRRKLKIQEMVSKYHLKMSEPEFFTALFQDVPKKKRSVCIDSSLVETFFLIIIKKKIMILDYINLQEILRIFFIYLLVPNRLYPPVFLIIIKKIFKDKINYKINFRDLRRFHKFILIMLNIIFNL
ncbi:hypothetical protein KUTeg_013109 [Tegillarca granosa]|uniref:Rap-GAP domain-containing protein n=1 Tax=Tegillarca granosa TaxID=220873 RepID=A0ABQ9EXX9_TEGGR|nr:hypothetical protein KUTeg_013109 [Tegillarca granosa]